MATPAPFRRLAGDGPAPARAMWLRAGDGVRLRAAHWPAAGDAGAGTVLLFSGRTEYLEKYARAGADLAAAGFDVIGLDWRGQGLSDRLQDDPRPGFVPDFADYQRDVATLVAAAEQMNLPQPWHLLSHSMGGAIALRALIEGLPARRAVFSAPMWGIRTQPMPPTIAAGLARVMTRLGRGGRPVAGTGGRGTWVLDSAFRDNLLTSDAAEWARLVAEAQAWPDVTLGGASWRWLAEALTECARLAALPSPAIPTLVTLGSDERIVDPGAIRVRVAASPQMRCLDLDGGNHEALFETPPIRDRALAAMIAHLKP